MTKKEYCERLCEFYGVTEPSWGLVALDYQVEGHDEFVYARFSSGSTKRFNVNCDSPRGIFFDFVKFVKDFNEIPWL